MPAGERSLALQCLSRRQRRCSPLTQRGHWVAPPAESSKCAHLLARRSFAARVRTNFLKPLLRNRHTHGVGVSARDATEIRVREWQHHGCGAREAKKRRLFRHRHRTHRPGGAWDDLGVRTPHAHAQGPRTTTKTFEKSKEESPWRNGNNSEGGSPVSPQSCGAMVSRRATSPKNGVRHPLRPRRGRLGLPALAATPALRAAGARSVHPPRVRPSRGRPSGRNRRPHPPHPPH